MPLIDIRFPGGLPGFIRRGDLSRERSEQRPDRYAVGDRIDARITNIDKRERKLNLSVKAHEVAEEKQAMAEYGSSDSGASLGDILGAALTRAREEGDGDEEAPAADAAPTAEAPAAEVPAEEAPAEEAAEEPAAEEPAAEAGDDEPEKS